MYGCLLSDIFSYFAKCESYLLSDVTYGACCVDDITADQLQADFLIHYGHSCLIPINELRVKSMYVFVDILIDVTHLVKTVVFNFPNREEK